MAKGETYYVEHVDANIPWTTKETPDNVRTKGAIKFKDCLVTISDDNCASLTVLTQHDIIRLRNQERGITRIMTSFYHDLVNILQKYNIKYGPIKNFRYGCGTRAYVCDILTASHMSILGMTFTDKYRVLMPNEHYYKAYDDPGIHNDDEDHEEEEDNKE